jgi:hypothetical protein
MMEHKYIFGLFLFFVACIYPFRVFSEKISRLGFVPSHARKSMRTKPSIILSSFS